MRRKMWFLFILLLMLISAVIGLYSNQPRFRSDNGHLYIESATSRNISLNTKGQGYININNENLLQVIELAKEAWDVVESFRSNELTTFTDTMKNVAPLLDGPKSLSSRVTALELQMLNNTALVSPPVKGKTGTVPNESKLVSRLNNLEKKVNNLVNLLSTSECLSNPCQNGGTCMDLYNGFQCNCPQNWQGRLCEIDVDECVRLAQTDLGCQNGAECKNTLGSYECICATNWYGLHCTKRKNDCNGAQSSELCGHGVCINRASAIGYTCICDEGWTNEGDNLPACTKDVDECKENRHLCSVNPPVECRNTKGSFTCGSCPQGYEGDGFVCTDVNECLVNNGGCSVNPRVQCINTRGSFKCESCPPGYSGDGFNCVYITGGACAINNGNCHPNAVCTVYAETTVHCVCRKGYKGNGYGINGCIIDSAPIDPCENNPCAPHGLCILNPKNNSFSCICNPGFTGKTCNVGSVDACFVNPCENGECVPGAELDEFICNCFPGYSGHLCQSELDECGGYFGGTNGTLRYPESNNSSYKNSMNCVWTIDAESVDVLNISFVWIDIEKSVDCKFDFVEILNGDDDDGKNLGRFCGNSLPKNNSIISDSNVVLIRFHSDATKNSRGFQLNYTLTRPVCGGELNVDSHGTLSSPGSPGKYPPNRDCYWTLNAVPGKRIQIYFFSLRFESHKNCSYDYLEIRDGFTQHSPILAKLCNTTIPPPVLTSGPHASLHFHSDNSGQDYGFQMAYSVIEGIPGCGGIHTSPTGYISSPVDLASDSNNYLDNLNCEWHIKMPLNQKLKLSFVKKFGIEVSINCSSDVLQIFDGPSVKSPLIGRYCGSTKFVHPIITNSNEVTLIFKSDYLASDEGFTIKYETLCGGTFTDSKGIIESPFYPNPYPQDKICTYIIAQPVGKAIKLSFLDMDIEDVSYPKCLFDSLEIRDGDNENSAKIASLCGSIDKLPKLPYISTHNYMWLKFSSDHSNNNKGFRANYSTIDIACGGILKEPTGIIQSSKHPEEYLHNQMCKWIIAVNESSQIQLTWLTFALENQLSCNNDYLEIYDNSISGNASKIARYCGSKIPPVLTSLGNRLTIIFKTDHSVAKDGFMLSYISLSKLQACGGNFFTPEGFIKSPNFPDFYPRNKDCVWTINVPVTNQIELNITQFNLEDSVNCRFDFLELRNGGYQTSPLIGKYCGSKSLSIVSSMGNSLFIRFVSDSSKEQKGFFIRWSITTKGCGGTLNMDNGHIASPNYPLPIQETLECFYKIAVAQGSQIKLTFLDLELTINSFPAQECKYDFIEVFDGGNTGGKSLGKYCSDVHSSTILHSSSNQMYIKYRNSGFSKGRGFSLLYTLDCNVTIKGYHGAIEMSIQESMRMAKCAWTIMAPKGNKVNMTFTSLNMVKSRLRHGISFYEHTKFQYAVNNNCNNTQLIVSEGADINEINSVLWRECMSEPPSIISSNENIVRVNYYSRNKILSFYDNIESFRLEWVVEGCGGTLDKYFGEFTSPGYPGSYPGGTTCEWHIIVDYGYTIEITIDELWLETSASCSFDFLAIYSGYDDSGPELLRLCHKYTDPITITSGGNEAFVRFESDSESQTRGFKATYKTVISKCGGRYTAPQGNIHTAHYPQNYDYNSSCLWYIEVAETHLINLTFVDFLTRNNDNVLVYDGDVHGKLLLNHTGNSVPPSIISSSNKITVSFEVGKSSILAKGFNAIYSTACGAKLVTNGSGIISNEVFLSHMLYKKCIWTIISDTPQSRVTLTFTHIDIVHHLESITIITNISNEVCSEGLYHTTFRVLDGRDSDAPEIIKFCKSNPIPPPIVSNGPAMRIEFTDNSDGYDSFSATYSVRSIACGGTYDTIRGTISSPNYPNNYYRDSECVWTLKSSVGNRVSLNFIDFELEDDEFCNEDYVEVRERNSSGPILGLFCGTNTPTNVTSGSSLWIKFRSNSLGSAKGFTADFEYVKNIYLTQKSGEISSPLYPRMYRNSEDYSWSVTVDEDKSVQIVLKEILCTSFIHHLKIYDGANVDAPLLYELSLDRHYDVLKNTITSRENMVYVELKAGSRRQTGIYFLLSWTQIDTPNLEPSMYNRSGSISDYEYHLSPNTNSSVIITNPGYPYGYAPNLNLTWEIHTEPHYHIEVNFLEIDLYPTSASSSETFNKDHITVETVDPDTAKTVLLATIYKNSNQQIDSLIGYNKVLLTFITNKALNGTGFKAVAKLKCGGRLRGPTGLIDLSNKTTHYNSDYIPCIWNVTVRPGRTISVKFLTIQFSSSYACVHNYVLLKNGFYEDSSLVGQGKYCSNTSTLLYTTENQLQVQVILSSIDSVKIAFEEKSINCGGQINLNDMYNATEITSPSYPNIPPAHIECIWTVAVPSGEHISVSIEDLALSSDVNNCENEYLELRDGASRLSRLMHHMCMSSTSYPDIQTTDNFLYIKYFTDLNIPSNGFKLNVSIASCGGVRRAYRGTISSPNFPGSYESNMDCKYLIIAPPNHRVSLNFETLSLKRRYPSIGRRTEEITNNTYDDSLTIYEVEPSKTMIITTIFGSNIPSQPIESSGRQLMIKFRSYPKNRPFYVDNGQGKFLITYQSEYNECDKEYDTESGEIISTSSTSSSVTRLYCTYVIKVPRGRRITAEVIEGKSIVQNCDGDRVVARNREILLAFLGSINYFDNPICLDPIINPTSLNYTFESTSNKMILIYENGRGNQNGFRIRFTSDKPSLCGGIIDDSSIKGSIVLPVENVTTFVCQWDFININGTIVFKANFKTFESNISCNYNNVLTATNGEENIVLKSYCPSSTQNDKFSILSPFPLTKLLVKANLKKVNFTATLDYNVNPCGGVIDGQKITITSPNYPSSFPEKTNCAWLLRLTEGENVNIRFNDLDLESSCENNYVKIHDGSAPDSPMLGKYCGYGVKPEILGAVSNNIWIEFLSGTGNSTKKGFNLTVESTKVECGIVYVSESGEFFTKNYPQLYPNNEECEWTIALLPGNRVNLQFVDRFSIEQSVNCTKDYIQVFDNRDDSWVPLGNRFCGRSNPPPFISSETKLKVRIRTDGDIQGDGFKATWNSICGGIFTENTGKIVSPNFPRQYLNNLKCNYTILAPGKTLQLIFKSFKLEDHDGCRYDNVTIYDKIGDFPERSEHVIGFYCGDRIPKTLTFKNSAMIIFKTDLTATKSGFEIHYEQQGCGGEITSPSLIRSPIIFDEDDEDDEVTSGYPNDANCTWIIRAPPDEVVQLAFTEFHLEGATSFRYTGKCYYDSVFLFDEIDRSTNDSQGLGLFCGNLNDRLPIVKSKTNTMYVSFTSDSSRRFKGFVGKITFTYGESKGCGGTIRLNQSNSMSEYRLKTPNLPIKTELECGWLILVDPSYEVQVELISYFETPKCSLNTTNCGCSSVQFFDGPGSLASQIHRYCSGNLDNPPMRSSGSEAFILYSFFNVDINVTFEIKIKSVISVCGPKALEVTQQTQVLTSPNYPKPYGNNLICKWTLEKKMISPTPVVVRFMNVDLEGPKDCSSNYLEVYYLHMSFLPVTFRLCHEDHEFDLVSDSSVTLTLRTNDRGVSKGFKLEYTNSNCLTTYNKSNGRISYDYGYGMSRPEECTFTINSNKPNSTISVYIFMSTIHSRNGTISLMAYDGPSISSKLISNLTGMSTTPSPIFSSGQSLTISYISMGRWTGLLDMTYTSTNQGKGCGGRLFNLQGMVTSPLYPSAFRESATCRWDISVPRPFPIVIRFKVFNLGTKKTCATDFVEIYDVNQATGSSSYVTKYCGGDNPDFHTSETGAVFIRYVTSEHNDSSGWVIFYRLKHPES